MNEQPQPENPEQDLFEYAAKHPLKTPVIIPQKQEEERDPQDTCTMCRNGGFCADHSVRPADISVLRSHPDVDYEELNKELASVHSRKPKDEIPLEEFIAGINEVIEKNNRKAS